MNALSKLAAKLAKKYAHEHSFDGSSSKEKQLMNDYEQALQVFEDDYLYGTSDDELHQLRRGILKQIEEIMFDRKETPNIHGDNIDLDTSIPKFLSAKLKLIEKALIMNRQKNKILDR
jgi:DNA-binding ferritin-like protein (Dps family)